MKTASVWQVRQPVYKSSKARWMRYKEWLTPLEEALAIVPAMPEPAPMPAIEPSLFTEGTAYLGKGDIETAIKCFETVLSVYPRHAAAKHFLGAAWLKSGNIEKALPLLRASVKLLPVHASWFANLAVAEEAAGQTEAAQAARTRAEALKQ